MASKEKHAQKSHYSYGNKDQVFRNFSMKAYGVSQTKQVKKKSNLGSVLAKLESIFYRKSIKGDK